MAVDISAAQTGVVEEVMQGNISEVDLHNTASAIDKFKQRLRNKAVYGGNNTKDTTKPPPKSSGLDIMKDDINDMPTSDMMEAISYAAEPQQQTGRVEIFDDDDHGDDPAPFNSANFEDDQDIIAKREARSPAQNLNSEEGYADDTIARKNQKQPAIVSLSAAAEDEESIYVPNREDIEGDNIQGDTNNGDGMNNRRGLREFEARRALNDSGDNEVDTGSPSVNQAVAICQEQALDVDQTIDQEPQGKFAAIIPEAFLVEEAEYDQPIVISGHAEPLIPWWKETGLKVLISLIVVAVLSITLGLTLSSYNTKTVTDVQVVIQSVIASDSPSTSYEPSSTPSNVPSMEPSSSSGPSPFPTTLLHKLENQQVVSDGSNMVMINQDSGVMLVLIYTLNEDGRMIPVSSFSEEDYGDEFTVSIKGNTTIIDYPEECWNNGAQIIYKLDSSSDNWVKIQDFECPEPESSESDEAADFVSAARPPFAAEDSSKSSSRSISKVNIILSAWLMTGIYSISK